MTSILEILTAAQNDNQFLRDATLPSQSWPGLYPVYYITKDCGALCVKCVNDNIKLIVDAALETPDVQWEVVGQELNYEDDRLMCGHCYELIPSAYGN